MPAGCSASCHPDIRWSVTYTERGGACDLQPEGFRSTHRDDADPPVPESDQMLGGEPGRLTPTASATVSSVTRPMWPPSVSTIIALRNQRLGFDQVRLDGPVSEHRPARAGRARPAMTNRRWRFDLLRARAA